MESYNLAGLLTFSSVLFKFLYTLYSRIQIYEVIAIPLLLKVLNDHLTSLRKYKISRGDFVTSEYKQALNSVLEIFQNCLPSLVF